MTFGPWDMLLDFCWMALLLCAGKIIRAKIKPIQYLYLPSSVIAGILGFVLGPQVLDIIPFSDQIQKYAWLLVVVLFASLPFSSPPVRSPKEIIKKAGSLFCFNMAAEVGFFGFSLLIGTTVFAFFFPEIESAFPLLLPAGFVGGHGYATAIGGTLEEQWGFEGALTIGYTFATIGILSSILFGIPLIKWAARKKLTRFITDMSELPESMRTGLLPEKEQKSMGRQTVSPSSLDPLAFHLMLILIATLGGYLVSKHMGILSQHFFSKPFKIPDIATAMLCGVLIKKIMNMLKMGDEYIDRQVVTRIGSTATDWLVGFGVASIKIGIVIAYIKPIIFMCLMGYIITFGYIFIFGPRMNPHFWFERSIFAYGWITGVVAMGITLLRIVDPEFKSQTLENYGLAYILISPVELFIVAFIPMFIGMGYMWSSIFALLGFFLFIIILSVVLKFWSNKYPFWTMREGEKEIMEGKKP